MPGEKFMAMFRYDAQKSVNSEDWLKLDEYERIDSVTRYHRRQRIRVPNEHLHALVHVIVENQVALGDTFVAEGVLLRLVGEGLDRHEAIHAIGSVLADHSSVLMSGGGAKDDPNAEYIHKLKSLTAESWRNLAS
jgi:hypothetical protein